MLAACVLLVSGCGRQAKKTEPADTEPRGASASPVSTTQATEVPAANPASDSTAVPSLEEIFAEEASGLPSDGAQTKSLAKLREQRDSTVWRMERIAQQHEQAIVAMWDQLLAEQRQPDGGDPFAVFAAMVFDSIQVGQLSSPREVGWGAVEQSADTQPKSMNAEQWQDFVRGLRRAGYRIEQTEWHHARFEKEGETEGARSTIRMAIYAVHPERNTRYVLGGNLLVQWHPCEDEQQLPSVQTVDATQLRLLSREGAVPFEEVLTIDHTTTNSPSGVQPISVRDLNGDGLDEIVLGGANEVYWNRGDFQFEKDTLLTYPERGFEVSLLADVTGDGICDFVYPGIAGDLLLYVGDEEGRFTTPPKGKARGGGPLRQPQVIAAGDIDNDGDVDLWIGQYKISYMGGQMPTPYYDANDGFPAYLLINEGGGQFVPQTEAAGLAAKAQRRSYSGSFVDLDGDRDLDLVVASDFAGIDVYRNDGQGKFIDVTERFVDERHLFGMSVTFADYDTSGSLDFFATGMASTTARRLDQMGLGRQDRPEIHKMRSVMGYGNRMYLQDAQGKLSQPVFVDQVARTGWSWGSSSFDFDNDGFPDIFVANGHSSGKSTKDHCSHFWCHDIYDATSRPDQEVFHVFQNSMKGYFDRSESWDGYQKNQLLLNRQGEGFASLGYLMGVGQEYDGRAVISADLDQDGKRDLIVVEDRWQDGQLLHVYRNTWQTDHHWIGLRLNDLPGPTSELGATAVLTLADGSQRVACVTAGDSIHAQHPPVVHFGLGMTEAIEAIELRFVNGETWTRPQPELDRYHNVEVK